MLLLGQGFEQLCDWTGIIISSFVNFLLPPYLYIKAVKLRHAMIKTRFSGSDMDSGDEQTQVVSNTNRNNSKSNISSSNNQLYRAQNTTTVNEMIGKISQIVTDSVSNATTRTKAKDSSRHNQDDADINTIGIESNHTDQNDDCINDESEDDEIQPMLHNESNVNDAKLMKIAEFETKQDFLIFESKATTLAYLTILVSLTMCFVAAMEKILVALSLKR